MTLSIQVASDLHLEAVQQFVPGERLLRPVKRADVLVLPGDIALGVAGVQAFADWPVPVVMVPGNHEFWRQLNGYEATLAAMREAAKGTSVHVLDNDALVMGGVRFLGATLWTDMQWRPEGSCLTPEQVQAFVGAQVGDHWLIREDSKPFLPARSMARHQAARRWLEAALLEPFEGPTVVVTHHAPHELSVHPKYQDDPLTAAFVSHLPELLTKADMWIHGHCHDSFDYSAEGCRVVANPRGYPRIRIPEDDARKWVFENAKFKPQLVIPVSRRLAGRTGA